MHPATGQAMAQAPEGTTADVDQAVAATTTAFPAGRPGIARHRDHGKVVGGNLSGPLPAACLP
ncbi:hypothetical protein ETD86_37755 [Nonomuraea turkmeniaca]|uniref:Uncharacterized protein n=1 Tax=Nonomuraea turkmeniaca TaxID=103838 RepID=A0A5S4F490_9ACTN|nr:hypothetical protein ETD86_37755 [Nonomuraea turkmeniaca]